MNAWIIFSGNSFVKAYNIEMTEPLKQDLISRIPGSIIICNSLGCIENKYGNRGFFISQGACYYIEESIDDIEVRRRILALLACQAINDKNLILHSCCIANQNKAVMLIGDYGSGKTTFALYMSKFGWEILSGDTSYISVAGRFIAGSRVVLTRHPVTPTDTPTLLPLPIGEVRWEACYCDGGPFDGVNLDSIVLFGDFKIRSESESENVMCESLYQSSLRVFKGKNSSWCEKLITDDLKKEVWRVCKMISKNIKCSGINSSAKLSMERLADGINLNDNGIH